MSKQVTYHSELVTRHRQEKIKGLYIRMLNWTVSLMGKESRERVMNIKAAIPGRIMETGFEEWIAKKQSWMNECRCNDFFFFSFKTLNIERTQTLYKCKIKFWAAVLWKRKPFLKHRILVWVCLCLCVFVSFCLYLPAVLFLFVSTGSGTIKLIPGSCTWKSLIK